MADASGMTPSEPEGNEDSRKTIGEAMKFWNWRLPPKGPKRERDPNRRTVGDAAKRLAQPWDWELSEKPVKWWTFWRWRFWHAGPPTLKRSPIPSLANLMKVDPTSWEIMGRWCNRLAVMAVCANLVICALYAFVVATQSELPITRGWDLRIPLPWGQDFLLGAVARYAVIVVLAMMALATAVVLQLGTDFAVPFAAGLAGEKYRVIPTLAFAVLWPICLSTTVIMKVDVYSGWGRERIAAATETATISDADQRILSKYVNAVPPPVAESEGKIANADAAISNADDAIKGLQTARDEQAALREREENDPTRPGRGPKWEEHNNAVVKADADIATQRQLKADATTARAVAIANKANRVEYDTAIARSKSMARVVTESERSLLYDADFTVWLRAGGMAFASFMFVLMSFMIRAAKAEAAKRSGAAQKGVQTKQQNKNTFEGEYEEAAPLNAPQVQDLGPVSAGAVAPADTGRKVNPGVPKHPDKAGDQRGDKATGYDDTLDLTQPADGDNDGTDTSGQSADQ